MENNIWQEIIMTLPGPILDIDGMGAFLQHIFGKSAYCLLTPPKQKPFLTISYKIIFSKPRALDLVR